MATNAVVEFVKKKNLRVSATEYRNRYRIFSHFRLRVTCKEKEIIKMLGPLARASNKLGRNVMTNFIRNHSHGGVPGEVSSKIK